MSGLQENIRNIIFYYIKQKYNNYLVTNNKSRIDNNELNMLVDDLYGSEKNKLQTYIRDCLKDMMNNDYNSPLVENIIFEIFDDEELAKNRVILEINNYQENRKNKNNVYEKELQIHKKYGIGLKLDFEINDIVVVNFKKNPENNSQLSGEINNISIGDSIIKINDTNLENKLPEESVDIFKQALTDNIKIKLTLKSYNKNNIENNELCNNMVAVKS